MKNAYILLIIIASSFLFFSCWQQTQNISNEGSNITTSTQSGVSWTGNSISDSGSTLWKNIIKITSNWFFPSTLTTKAWDRVEFVNTDTSPHWPASDPHPIHTGYPGSWIDKCWTQEQINIFDACKWLSQNEIFTFVFNERWTWWFHDHLNHTLTWTIIVK